MMTRLTTLAVIFGTLALQSGGVALASGQNKHHKHEHPSNSSKHHDKHHGEKPPKHDGSGTPGVIVDPVRNPPTKIVDPIPTTGGVTVRDHRHPSPPPVAGNGQGGVTVTNTGAKPIIRDHRMPTLKPAGGFGQGGVSVTNSPSSPIVRDHRGAATMPVVRDHRDAPSRGAGGGLTQSIGGGVAAAGSGLQHAAGSAAGAVGRGASTIGHAAGSAAGAVGRGASAVGHAASSAAGAVGDLFGF
jgi:hypothetical protein